MRRGLEPGPPADTSAGQERDTVLADVPAGRLGGVARVRVLGREDEQRLLEPLVQGGEDERQRRLGDAGASRKSLDVGGEALAVGELEGQRVENGTVHDD